MKLFFVNGLRAGEELEFAVPEITIGRELDNLVNIPEEGVSRYHGKISLQSNGKWIVADTGSTNGIKCNRVKISGPQELNEGDLIEFGNQMIRVTELRLAARPIVFSPLAEEQPAPAPAAQVRQDITTPQAPPQNADIFKEEQATKAAPPPKHYAKEISEALRDGKIHLFGDNKDADPADSPKDNGQNTGGGKKRKQLFTNRLYYTTIACLAVMGVTFFLKINQPPQDAVKAADNQIELDAKSFMLYYEKQIISPDNVFLFVLHIENGEATFQIDDLKSYRSFARSKIPFTADAYERFHSDLEHEYFFRATSPEKAPDMGGRRDYRRLVICDRGRLHELEVLNNMRPNALERMESAINLFAENHALRTVAMTPEELREEAERNFNTAEDLFLNRQSRPANLRDAIQRYRLTVEYLNAFVPHPKLWDKARKKLNEAEKIRADRLAALRSERIRLGQLKEFAAALPVLDEIMALSDQDSPDFSDARKMRIKIDSYLRKQGGRR